MMNHECIKIVDITRLDTEQQDIKQDIKDIKDTLTWLNRYVLMILISIIIEGIFILLKLK